MATDKEYKVTGTLHPDATGTYEDVGEHEGERYYRQPATNWYIWWNGIDTWFLNDTVGEELIAGWSRVDPDIEGAYDPILPATGDATVTEL